MAKFSPQYNPHKITATTRCFIEYAFYTVFILSILYEVVPFPKILEPLKDFIAVVNTISIFVFFGLEIIVEYFLYPQSEQRRRDDFIDNSFGSNFSIVNSIEYYDNEEIKKGLYKSASNLFENCFFTYSLSKVITVRRIILPVIILISVLVCAFYGFKNNSIAQPILQILFSANMLGLLIKHLIFLNRLNSILDFWVVLFQNPDFKVNSNKYEATIYRNWLTYETLLSRIQPNISQKVFDEMNPILTTEWNNMKITYNI
ncbi:MAG: hypothetical protein RJA07_2 [Bacteroidota bacterium]|jgi:hypothetical protein